MKLIIKNVTNVGGVWIRKKYESDFYIIEYDEKDKKYIDLFVSTLNKSYQDIMNFFNLDNLEKKITIKLWNNVTDFRNHTKNKLNIDEEEWVIARAYFTDKEIHILTLEEIKKCKGHSKDNIENMLKCLTQEFVHICHSIYSKKTLRWYGESLAVILSNQYNNYKLYINCTLDELLNGYVDYINYYTIGKYLFDTYDRKYILKLLKDKNLLEEQTPRIYEETKLYIKNIKSR